MAGNLALFVCLLAFCAGFEINSRECQPSGNTLKHSPVPGNLDDELYVHCCITHRTTTDEGEPDENRNKGWRYFLFSNNRPTHSFGLHHQTQMCK